MLEPNFWKDRANAQNIIKKFFEDLINSLKISKDKLNDYDDLNELAIEEKNQNIQSEIIENTKKLKKLVKKMRLGALSNEADTLDCYIEIHAGAGGTESQDWAEMLEECI